MHPNAPLTVTHILPRSRLPPAPFNPASRTNPPILSQSLLPPAPFGPAPLPVFNGMVANLRSRCLYPSVGEMLLL